MRTDHDPHAILEPLKADLRDKQGGLGFEHIDYLVISGDLTNTAAATEFERAFQFVSSLIREFQLNAQHCIVVPGNHDLKWIMPYDWSVRQPGDTQNLPHGHFVETEVALAVRNQGQYRVRFQNFSDCFYHPFFQLEYPLAFEDQCIPFLFEESRIQFLAMNSCWEIDEFYKQRSGIHMSALEHGLAVAEEQVQKAMQDPSRRFEGSLLRLAIWHHPVAGGEAMRDVAFLDRLRQTGFSVCLHGHVHDNRTDLVGYLHPRRMHVVGAGSFGASARERPESVPRLYNVIEIAKDHSFMRVHTRCLRAIGGAWEGWAVWPGDTPHERRTYYQIDLLSLK